jgi:hypothetical protein
MKHMSSFLKSKLLSWRKKTMDKGTVDEAKEEKKKQKEDGGWRKQLIP